MTVTGRSSTHLTGIGSGIRQFAAENHWYALYTRHQHEKVVAESLSNKGHHVFLPLYGTTHLWRNRPKQLHLPLFPGYVFIQGGVDRQNEIMTTPGIISLVRSGMIPAIVSPEQIAAVRRIVENPFQVEPHAFLERGDRVRVISGALQGVEGILVRIKGKFQVVVSMELLGRSAAVEIEASCVQRMYQPIPAVRPRPSAVSA